MNSVYSLKNYIDIKFQGHKFAISNVNMIGNHVYTLDEKGKICIWKWVDDHVSEGYKKH